MAKELPYFQFEPAEYLSKDISFCSLSAQGLFINICAYYWLRKCKITKEQVLRRLNYPNELEELISEGIIDIKRDYIVIKFLDNQMVKATKLSTEQSRKGKLGGRPKKPNKSQTKAEEKPNESHKIREDKIKGKEIKQDKKNIPLSEIKISDLENEDVQYFQIAKAFQDLFIKNLNEKNAPTKNQTNAKYKNYVDPIRLMMTNDGITKEQITKVFKFLDSPAGDFWKPNILSTKKLREKFEQLIIKSQSPNGNGKQPEQRTNEEIARDAFNSETAKNFRFS